MKYGLPVFFVLPEFVFSFKNRSARKLYALTNVKFCPYTVICNILTLKRMSSLGKAKREGVAGESPGDFLDEAALESFL